MMQSSNSILKFVGPAFVLGCCLGLYSWKFGIPVVWSEEGEFQPLSLSGNDSDFSYFSTGGGEEPKWSGTFEDLTENVDLLMEGNSTEQEKAFGLLHSVKSKYATDADFVWRYAKSTFQMSQVEAANGLPDKEKELVFQSQFLAGKALNMNPNNSNIHKWYAITLGKLGDYESAKDRIQHGYEFKDHINQAIKLDPEDPNLYYLLGRWCYGVYELTWVERKLAAALFADPPSASVDDALQNFMEAEKRKPGELKSNMMFIAKCLVQKRDYSEAVKWMDKATTVPIHNYDDRITQEELDKLLYSYSGYRQ